MEAKRTISADFPFKSKFLEIQGSRVHYIDAGEGDPILFLHGNPTSAYLWRNIIPHLAPHGRCIAPDLIGMGRSDKPQIDYRFQEHYGYIEGFIDRLHLENITFVVHDWGSALGFHYAMWHEDNVKGIAFMEAIVKTFNWSDFNKDFKTAFKLMRTPGVGWLMISALNVFLKQIMPKSIVRQLSAEEKAAYEAPFQTIASRQPIRQWPCEIPIDGEPADVHQVVSEYSRRLGESDLPKLLLHASPGGIIDAKGLEWCKRHIKNLTTVDVGPGIHYIQEDNPYGIGRELVDWYLGL